MSASPEEDGLDIEAPRASMDIAYGDITSVELRSGFDDDRRVGGREVPSGNSQNDEFGRYTFAQHSSVRKHIVVHHSGGCWCSTRGGGNDGPVP